jgi:hypothetical protein
VIQWENGLGGLGGYKRIFSAVRVLGIREKIKKIRINPPDPSNPFSHRITKPSCAKYNWFQRTCKWFQRTCKWFTEDLQVVSEDLQVVSEDLQVVSEDLQVVSKDLQVVRKGLASGCKGLASSSKCAQRR